MKKGAVGIDLSFHKGKPDWDTLAPHLDFAILGVTQRYGLDGSFEHNYEGATSHGVPVGAYKYSYAQSKAESRMEAKALLETLKGRKLDLPIFLDMEWGIQEKLSMETRRKIIRVFEKAVKSAGYQFGIYCNLNWYRNYIPESMKNRKFWVASYPNGDCGIMYNEYKPTEVRKLYCWQYSEKGHFPGIDGEVDLDIWYGKPKSIQTVSQGVTAEDIIRIASYYVGTQEGDEMHRFLVDTYNAYEPLAQGYRVSYTDSWCAVSVSDWFILNNAVSLIGGTECGVQRFVEIFKSRGIWKETPYIPTRGDIIVFDWDHGGFADHIGIVETVQGIHITTIEGNASGAVRRRTYELGDPDIYGYAHPMYDSAVVLAPQTDYSTIVAEVRAGKWGNDPERSQRLAAAGYDPEKVRAMVNAEMGR